MTIRLNIYNRNKIYHDARFVIEQSGFLGDKYVSVIPTTNSLPLLKDGDEVPCQEPFNLQEVARSTSGFIKRIEDTARKLDDSVTDLRRVVLNEQTLTNFAVAMNNMRSFSEQAMGTLGNINALVATNGAQIDLAVSNLVVFSQELSGLATSAQTLLATNGTDISTAVKNIESSTEVLKNLMTDLQSGKGIARNGASEPAIQHQRANHSGQSCRRLEQFEPARAVPFPFSQGTRAPFADRCRHQ